MRVSFISLSLACAGPLFSSPALPARGAPAAGGPAAVAPGPARTCHGPQAIAIGVVLYLVDADLGPDADGVVQLLAGGVGARIAADGKHVQVGCGVVGEVEQVAGDVEPFFVS